MSILIIILNAGKTHHCSSPGALIFQGKEFCFHCLFLATKTQNIK